MRQRKVFYANGESSPWFDVKNRPMHNTIGGEPVICKSGGETLEFGNGDTVQVQDSFEKARELRKRGLMPAPTGVKNRPDPKPTESFQDFWERTTGRSREAIAEHCQLVDRR